MHPGALAAGTLPQYNTIGIIMNANNLDEHCALLGCYATSGQFLTDVSGQPIRPILRGQDETDGLPRNVGKKLTTTHCVITQKSLNVYQSLSAVLLSE